MSVQLPNHILSALKNGKTSLGDHPCFPPESEEKFVVSLMKKRFSEVSKETSNFSTDELKRKLGRYITKVQKLESDEKGALETICKGLINEMFQIPQDTIHIEPHLVQDVDVSKERLRPESDEDFEFEDIDSINRLTEFIYKRRMLNALVAGASAYYANNIDLYAEELSSVNPELPLLYKKISLCNDYLLMTEKDCLPKDDKKYTDAGTVEVYINGTNDMPRIDAYGITFPVMFLESIKGLLEIACTHGLPDRQKDAEFVMKKADFKLAENWDLRLGYPLWERIVEVLGTLGVDPIEVGLDFLFKEIALLPYDEFNSFFQEVFAKTSKGKIMMSDIVMRIEDGKERDDFDNYMQDKASEFHQINDSIGEEEYFTVDELGGEDELINEELITESFSKYLYHFTHVNRLASILDRDALNGSTEDRNINYKGSKTRGISFSRTPLPNVGYASVYVSRSEMTRICIDGEKLNYNYQGGPFSYFLDSPNNDGKKRSAKQRDLDNNSKHCNEYEERLYIKKGNVLTNLHEYVTGIDILYDEHVGGNREAIANYIHLLVSSKGGYWKPFFRFYLSYNDFVYSRNAITCDELLSRYQDLQLSIPSEGAEKILECGEWSVYQPKTFSQYLYLSDSDRFFKINTNPTQYLYSFKRLYVILNNADKSRSACFNADFNILKNADGWETSAARLALPSQITKWFHKNFPYCASFMTPEGVMDDIISAFSSSSDFQTAIKTLGSVGITLQDTESLNRHLIFSCWGHGYALYDSEANRIVNNSLYKDIKELLPDAWYLFRKTYNDEFIQSLTTGECITDMVVRKPVFSQYFVSAACDGSRRYLLHMANGECQSFNNVLSLLPATESTYAVMNAGDGVSIYNLQGKIIGGPVHPKNVVAYNEFQNKFLKGTDLYDEYIAEEAAQMAGKNYGALGESIQEKIAFEEQSVNLSPSEKQKLAGNYKMGHVTIDGLRYTIENPKGSTRSGVDKDGNEWSVVMNNTYGYIRGAKGVDGDEVDMYISDSPTEGNIYVIDQLNPDGSFDEHKVMYGFNSYEDAKANYLANFSEGWNGLGKITEISKEDFRKWLRSSHRKRKPFADYVKIAKMGTTIGGEELTESINEYHGRLDNLVVYGLLNIYDDFVEPYIGKYEAVSFTTARRFFTLYGAIFLCWEKSDRHVACIRKLKGQVVMFLSPTYFLDPKVTKTEKISVMAHEFTHVLQEKNHSVIQSHYGELNPNDYVNAQMYENVKSVIYYFDRREMFARLSGAYEMICDEVLSTKGMDYDDVMDLLDEGSFFWKVASFRYTLAKENVEDAMKDPDNSLLVQVLRSPNDLLYYKDLYNIMSHDKGFLEKAKAKLIKKMSQRLEIVKTRMKKIATDLLTFNEDDDFDESYGIYENIMRESANDEFGPYELIEALKNEGDFYYWFKSPFDRYGRHLHVANSDEIQEEIFKDIEDCGYIELSHDLDDDYYLTERCPDGFIAYKLCSVPNQNDYYVILTNLE